MGNGGSRSSNHYKIGEVAALFQRSSSWVRWRERESSGFGGEVVPQRDAIGHRVYTQDDIAAIARYLYRQGKIEPWELQRVIDEVSA